MKKLTYLLAFIFLFAFQNCKNENDGNAVKTTDTKRELEAVTNNERALNKVLPPFENVEVSFSKYTVDVAKGRTIQKKNGTVIIRPKGAFKDANGNPVKGKVDISYREFHDAAAIIASGIPMTNTEKDKYMETAGMFEINGTQNGQMIGIADDKEIEVKMASFVEGENFDFFHFDKKTCNWNTKGTAKPTKNVAKLQKIKNLPLVPNKPIKPTKFDEDAFVFDFDIDYNDFPELRAYHGVVWQYDEENKTNLKTNQWVFQEEWTTIDVQANQAAVGKYKLILKNEKKSFSANVKPALKGLDYEKAIAIFKEKNEKYVTLKAAKKEEETRLDNEADLVRSFKVSNFGIFNWDIWKRLKRKRCIASFDFGENTNVNINKISVFLVTGTQRSVVRYYPNDFDKFAFNPNENNLLIAVLPNNKIAYFNAADFENIDTELLENNKTHTFKMNIESMVVASVNDLETIIEKLS